jgi:cell division control protein 24
MQICGFLRSFSLANPDHGQSIDPIRVIQLWDLFSLGIPLFYIFDLLSEEDDLSKINYSEFNQDVNPDCAKTRAIALFAIQLRTDYFKQKFPDSEPFTVTDLWDCNSTVGFLKVCVLPLSAVLVLSVAGRRCRDSNHQLSSPGCV